MMERIAFLGPSGSFGHVVAEQSFTADRIAIEGIQCIDNGSVVSHVADDLADWGVVPIENSTEGPVGATLNSLHSAWKRGTPVHIYGQAIVPIEHCIIGLPNLGEVRTVMTHPQAYGQCRGTIARKYGNVQFVPTNSTAGAVLQLVEQNDQHSIAIAHSRAAQVYGAQVVMTGAQDRPNNHTRFVIVSRMGDHGQTPDDQTLVMLSCAKDTPGSLVEVLTALSGHGINMNMVMSLPGDELGHYRFCLAFSGHRSDPRIACAIDIMTERSEWLYVFGSFPA